MHSSEIGNKVDQEEVLTADAFFLLTPAEWAGYVEEDHGEDIEG